MAATHTTERPLELDVLCAKLGADFASLLTGTGTKPEAVLSNFYTQH